MTQPQPSSEFPWPPATVTGITANVSMLSDANTPLPPLDISQAFPSPAPHSSSSGPSFPIDNGLYLAESYQYDSLVPAEEVASGSREDKMSTCPIDASSQNFSSPIEGISHASHTAKEPIKQPSLHGLSPVRTLKNSWTQEGRINGEADNRDGDKENKGHRIATVLWPLQEHVSQNGNPRSCKRKRITTPREDRYTIEPALRISPLCRPSPEILKTNGERESSIHLDYFTNDCQLIETLPSWDGGVLLPPLSDWRSCKPEDPYEQRVDGDGLQIQQRNLEDLFKILHSLFTESKSRLQQIPGTAALSLFEGLPSPRELTGIGLNALQEIFLGNLPTMDVEVYALLHLALACAIYNNPLKRLVMKKNIFTDFLTWGRTVESKDKSPLAIILYHLWDPYCNGTKDARQIETLFNTLEIGSDGDYDINIPNSPSTPLSSFRFDSDEYYTSPPTYSQDVQDTIALLNRLRKGISVRLCMLYLDGKQFAGSPDGQREPYPRSTNTPSPPLKAELVMTPSDQYQHGGNVAPLHCHSWYGGSICYQESLEQTTFDRSGTTSQTRQSTANSNESRSSFSSFTSDPVMQSPFTQMSFDESFEDHLDVCTERHSPKMPEEFFVNNETCKKDQYNPPRTPITCLPDAESNCEQHGGIGDSRDINPFPFSPARSSSSNSTEGSQEEVDPSSKKISLQCPKCEARISGKERNAHQNLLRHMNTIHSESLLVCRHGDCDVTFTRSDNRKFHEITMHDLHLRKGVNEKEIVSRSSKRRKVSSAHQPQHDSLVDD